MKYFEIILKLAFIGDFLYLLVTRNDATVVFIFLIALILGIVLIFNKKQSYGYELSSREIVIRRIEGVILILFAVIGYVCIMSLTTI